MKETRKTLDRKLRERIRVFEGKDVKEGDINRCGELLRKALKKSAGRRQVDVEIWVEQCPGDEDPRFPTLQSRGHAHLFNGQGVV